jgi:excinuclease ABC subunit A
VVRRGGARRDERAGHAWIEHMRQREVIKTADWVLDLGPEGGDKGGEVVAEGTPEQVADEPRSYTGGYLKQLLRGPRAEPTRSRRKKARASASMREREAAE